MEYRRSLSILLLVSLLDSIHVSGSVISIGLDPNEEEIVEGEKAKIVCKTENHQTLYWFKTDRNYTRPDDVELTSCNVKLGKCLPPQVGTYTFSIQSNSAIINIPNLTAKDSGYWFCDHEIFCNLQVKVPIKYVNLTIPETRYEVGSRITFLATTSFGRPQAADVKFTIARTNNDSKQIDATDSYHITDAAIATLAYTLKKEDVAATVTAEVNNTIKDRVVSNAVKLQMSDSATQQSDSFKLGVDHIAAFSLGVFVTVAIHFTLKKCKAAHRQSAPRNETPASGPTSDVGNQTGGENDTLLKKDGDDKSTMPLDPACTSDGVTDECHITMPIDGQTKDLREEFNDVQENKSCNLPIPAL